MDGIVKIVLALKLKFLLIILSMGVSYFIEHKAIKQADPVTGIESVRTVVAESESSDYDEKSLIRMADDSNTSWSGPGNHFPVQPVNYVTNRPFTTQGLEIYIVL